MRRCATTLESEMSEEELTFLVELLGNEQLTGPHLEIGTAAGGTLCRMMKCFDEDRRPNFVVVDRMSYFPDQQGAFRSNLKSHDLDPDSVDLRINTSQAAFVESSRSSETFDFILIDASHKILAVMADLRWARQLNVGGIVCLHDYADKFPGVVLAVDRFLASHPEYENIGSSGSLLALRKTRPSRHREVTPFDRLYSYALFLPLLVQRKLAKRQSRQKAA